MQRTVSVIPEDKCIVVDGIACFFEYSTHRPFRALQWEDNAGHIEPGGSAPPRPLSEADYDQEIAPYVLLWQGERENQLARARADAVISVRTERKKREDGGFTHNGIRWGSAEKDERRLNSAVVALEGGLRSLPGWKINDAVTIEATLPVMREALSAMLLHHSACFAAAEKKERQLPELDTPEAVGAWMRENLNIGWPE